MDECRDPKFNQEGVGKFTKLDEGLKQEEECHRHVVEEVTLRRDPMESSGKITETDNQLLEQTSNSPEEVGAVLDNTLGDSSALEHTVADLVRELGANGNDDDRQAFTACDLNTLRTEGNRQIANNEGSGIENQDGLFELRNVDVMEGGQSVNGVSEGDIKSLAVSYLLGLDTKKDLVGSSRNLHDSHIIKIKSYTDDLGILETVENKYNKNKCIVGEQSSLRISFSSESEMVSTDAVMRSNSRVRISPQDLEGWLSDSSDMISLIPGVTLEEGGELTGTGEAIVKKEEAVIHIMDGESMNETNELLTPSSFMPGKEMGAAGVSSLTEAKEMVAETPSLMLSLPFVTSQATMNVAVMEGTILIKGSKDESLQVPAKVVCLPESDESNLEPPEEACAAFAPQLLEGGVLVLGDNIIMMKNQLYLTHVELVAAEGDTHTQISISPPTDRMETYHNKKVNFVLITLESDQSIGPPTSSSTNQKLAGFSQGQEDRLSVHNAPHSDDPGLFQCDKCYKSYKVRSSLNSHKVTHNSEKMYKCDECDKAFHYSTPLQIHKRIHTDERPYKCDGCSASFRSKANLKYHKRLHTGERPIACRECDQCFKDYTSLKRHRLKVHNMSSLKCSKCSEVSLSVEHLAAHMWQVHDVLYVEESPNSCEKCGESFSDKRAYNNHMVVHERRNKAGHVGLRKLTDYTHKCGICNMTCQNKTQMLVHIQVHAAVKRFKCRYCHSAFIYRFLLAEHVREEHPDNPEWFCQYCDEVFETCRKMTSHSCRTVRGDYNCPHCSFKTEVRHRLFRHIVKMHPEDKMPYYCEFCKNSFEDPNKLRYHQKREHPEKMLALSLQRDSTKSGSGGKDKGGESPNIDLSQVEMTIEGNTLIYFIPEDLRNDDVFKEKVKFKCFYCEAKFPIKNSMTRHILREHPGEKAYKCLQCNIFLKSNTESKNHHRRYHKFSATGGRDPNRNERAMMKKAQWLQDQLNNSDSRIKNLYKFNCRFCPMVYREKRSLVAHYRKWHPDEEWDYLPDKPIHSPPQATRKKRILIYYDCSFHDDCHAVFDDAAMLREHLFNAHNIAEELTEKYISKRLVIDHLRRGRLPKNAIDKQVKRQRCGKGKPESRKGSVTPTDNTDSDNEEGVDDPMDLEDTSDSKFGLVDSLQETLSTESVIPGTDDIEVDKKMPNLTQHLSEQQTREDNIGSLRDVKKMLYRCHRCSRSFPSRSEYREHVAQARHTDCRAFVHHLDIKQEPPDEEDEGLCRREFHSSYKSSVDDINESEGTAKAKKPRLDRASVKMEVEVCHNEEESIAITSLEERDEALLRVLSIHAPELSPEPVDVKVGMPLGIFDQMDKVCSASSSQIMGEGDAASASEASNVNLREIDTVGVKPTVIEEEAEMNKNAGVEENSGRAPEIGIERRGSRRGKGKRERGNEQKAIEERNRGGKKERAVQKKVCEQCCAAFKTRAELSFHLRFDH